MIKFNSKFNQIHFVIGVLGIIGFLLQGQYMDIYLDHLRGMDHAPRMLYRSSHIYLLLASIINVVMGLFWDPHKLKYIKLQYVGSVLIILSPIFLQFGFMYEPYFENFYRPFTRIGLYALFGTGVGFSIIGIFSYWKSSREKPTFKMSTNFAVRTQDIQKAKAFYSDFLGFKLRNETSTELDIDAHPLTLFAIKDEITSGPILELFVPNLEKAKIELQSKGCTIIKWEGKGKDCYIKDPFGVVFNIWEEK